MWGLALQSQPLDSPPLQQERPCFFITVRVAPRALCNLDCVINVAHMNRIAASSTQ
jgi:hypothetical protein